MSKKKFKSDVLESIHDSAAALHKVGAMDKATMKAFDLACIAHIPQHDAAQIKKIRDSVKVSQPVFAIYLNTSESTVQKWEAGTKKPSGMALKLLNIVNKHGLTVLA
jgi:putative transcriptional regulator